MKEYNGVKYYTKEEVSEMISLAVPTISKRVATLNIVGTRFGRSKHYNAEEIELILHPEKAAKNE